MTNSTATTGRRNQQKDDHADWSCRRPLTWRETKEFNVHHAGLSTT